MLLVRHGESEWNRLFSKTRRDPGIRDPRLTETGREQAAAAAVELRRRGVQRILASPYRRALETATIIADLLDVPVEVEPLAGEHAAFSCDVGTPRTELEALFPRLDLSRLPEIWWPDLDEPRSRLHLRLGELRAALAARDDRPGLALVCHWGVIRTLTGQEVHNCAIVPFDPASPWEPPGD